MTVLVCTQLMNLVLVPWLAHAGLALSISLGAWLNAGWLLRGLKKRGSYIPRAGWRPFMLKVAVALAAMGVLLGFVSEYFDWGAMQSQPWLRIGLVLGMVVGGALLYFGLLMAMGLNIRQVMRPPAEKTRSAPRRRQVTRRRQITPHRRTSRIDDDSERRRELTKRNTMSRMRKQTTK